MPASLEKSSNVQIRNPSILHKWIAAWNSFVNGNLCDAPYQNWTSCNSRSWTFLFKDHEEIAGYVLTWNHRSWWKGRILDNFLKCHLNQISFWEDKIVMWLNQAFSEQGVFFLNSWLVCRNESTTVLHVLRCDGFGLFARYFTHKRFLVSEKNAIMISKA